MQKKLSNRQVREILSKKYLINVSESTLRAYILNKRGLTKGYKLWTKDDIGPYARACYAAKYYNQIADMTDPEPSELDAAIDRFNKRLLTAEEYVKDHGFKFNKQDFATKLELMSLKSWMRSELNVLRGSVYTVGALATVAATIAIAVVSR